MRPSLSIGARLAVLMVSVIVFVIGVTSGFSIYSFRQDLNASIASKNEVMHDALRRKGEAIARNVALVSSRSLVTANYSFLLEVVKAAVANDSEVSYGMLMSENKRAVIHSDPALANATLDDGAARFASEQKDVATQTLQRGDDTILEVIAPIALEDKPWGWARFGLSTRRVQEAIAQSEATAQEQIRKTVLLNIGSAVLLMFLGAVFGIAAARSLLQPLDGLMGGAKRLREGDMSTAVPVRGSSEFQTLALVFNDMTDAVRQRETQLQSALEQAREANRLKSEFLANVSHELRTPLNAIINIPSALLRDYKTKLVWHCEKCQADYEPDTEAAAPSDEMTEPCPECQSVMHLTTDATYEGAPTKHYHFLSRTLQAAQHLLAVVNDILDFSKLEAGKMTLKTAPMSLASVCAEVDDTISVLASKKKITVNWPKIPSDLTMVADSVKLAQVLLNLTSNAIKFTPVSGRIDVLFEQSSDGSMVTFGVRDTGIGIPKDKQSSLFESFRQVDGSHTRSHGGTGLGLAISRKLVELHGGKIWMESELNQGSTFWFSLPTRFESTSTPVATSGHHTGRILVLDDDRSQQELVKHFLQDAGYSVVCADDASQLQGHLDGPAFDAVILDVMMPETSGITALKSLKRRPETQSIPVIVTTAYHANKDVVESLGALWLPKPWDHDALVQMVSKVAKSTKTNEG